MTKGRNRSSTTYRESAEVSLSVVIPTLGRERVLMETIEALLACDPAATEIIVVDQTERHEEQTEQFLRARCEARHLRWLRLATPSIPTAMNVGLAAAQSAIVLFVDDDVVPAGDLFQAHIAAHIEFADAWAVAGQVLQPGESPGQSCYRSSAGSILADLDFPFWSDERAWIANVMAGNLSVKRDKALAAGGFDENFEGVAFRFETEFARRLCRLGGQILFEPAASLRHLRAVHGGTRALGSHLTSASGRHGMGDYYFAMRSGWNLRTMLYMIRRPLREVTTRFHLRHPWYIPIKLMGEIRAFRLALSKWRRGPKFQSVLQQDVVAEGCTGRHASEYPRIDSSHTKCAKT